MALNFVATGFTRGDRKRQRSKCGRSVTVAAHSGDGELERRRRFFEYYEKLGDDEPKKTDGWVLIYGSDLAMWENNLLEAGIAPARDVHTQFVTDVQIDYEMRGMPEYVYVLAAGRASSGQYITMRVCSAIRGGRSRRDTANQLTVCRPLHHHIGR